MYRTRVVLVALAVLATAVLAFAPAMGSSHRDPEPTRWIQPDGTEAANRFVLNVAGVPLDPATPWDHFRQVGPDANGNWLYGPAGSVVVNSVAGYETFWISNRSYEGVKLVLDVVAPATATGLFGFTLNHKSPLDNGSVYDTIILDWADDNRSKGGYTSEQGFTLYHINTAGLPLDDLDRDPCFWSKWDCPLSSPFVPGHLEVLDQWTHSQFAPGAPVPSLGWVPGETYRFEVLYYNEDISPGSYGILVRVQGGTGHFANGRDVIDWRPTGSEAWLPYPGYDVREFVNPQPLGFYSYDQADVEFGSPAQVTYVDMQRPKIDVQRTCSVPMVNDWCPDILTVDVNVQEMGSGIAAVSCSISNGPAFPDCDLAPFNVATEGATIQVTAIDHGGKYRTISRNLKIDQTPPVLAVTASCQGSIVNDWCNANVDLDKAFQSTSGIDYYVCQKSLSGGAWQNLACMQPVAQDGDYRVRVQGLSKVGYWSNVAEVSFLRDATKPVGEFLTPKKGCTSVLGQNLACPGVATVTLGDVPVQVQANDPVSNGVASGMLRVDLRDQNGVFASIVGNGDNGVYEGTWRPASIGEHTIYADLIDNAGNVRTLQVRVDVALPGL